MTKSKNFKGESAKKIFNPRSLAPDSRIGDPFGKPMAREWSPLLHPDPTLAMCNRSLKGWLEQGRTKERRRHPGLAQ